MRSTSKPHCKSGCCHSIFPAHPYFPSKSVTTQANTIHCMALNISRHSSSHAQEESPCHNFRSNVLWHHAANFFSALASESLNRPEHPSYDGPACTAFLSTQSTSSGCNWDSSKGNRIVFLFIHISAPPPPIPPSPAPCLALKEHRYFGTVFLPRPPQLR